MLLRVPANQPYTLGLTDLAGRVLLTHEGTGTGLPQTEPINLHGRYAGSAVVYLRSNGRQVGKRILIRP